MFSPQTYFHSLQLADYPHIANVYPATNVKQDPSCRKYVFSRILLNWMTTNTRPGSKELEKYHEPPDMNPCITNATFTFPAQITNQKLKITSVVQPADNQVQRIQITRPTFTLSFEATRKFYPFVFVQHKRQQVPTIRLFNCSRNTVF